MGVSFAGVEEDEESDARRCNRSTDVARSEVTLAVPARAEDEETVVASMLLLLLRPSDEKDGIDGVVSDRAHFPMVTFPFE